MSEFGPREPVAFADLRAAYWRRRGLVDAVEGRLCLTEEGMAWVYRTKAIGHKRPRVDRDAER